MRSAKPKSHGNYVESLQVVESIIQREMSSFDDLDVSDMPAFTIVFISDGKPSDNLFEHRVRRESTMASLADKLKSKLTFLGMGIGASGSEFEQMESLANTAKCHGAEGSFVHAGLNPTSISTSLSTIATSMTATRNDLLSKKDSKITKKEKTYTMRKKKGEYDGIVPLRRETNGVTRWLYDSNLSYPWRAVSFINNDAAAFEMEKDPFGKGAERLAYMFYEIKHNSRGWERVGKAMVAKESRYIEDEESKETFHTDFCRVQKKASDLAKQFNEAVKKAPLLKPSGDEVSKPPPIVFLKCSVYEYYNRLVRCGLLVEKYLNGRFTKYNGNDGYVKDTDNRDEATLDLAVGEVKLTDFVQAFSHWVYEISEHNLVVCDLQGILDLEGILPVFRLTDPAICSKKRHRYGKTDLGMRGIRNFCRYHKCNGVCRALSLPSMRTRQSPRLSQYA
jgi:hypothetical protein